MRHGLEGRAGRSAWRGFLRLSGLMCVLTFSSLMTGAQQASSLPATTPEQGKTTAVAGEHNLALPPEKASPVRLPRFDKPPVIDGKLDDEVWKQSAVLKDFYQIHPGDNIAPSEPTEVLIGYDSSFLYVAFRAFDGSGKVRATIPKRDAIFDDDYVGFYIDTFNDQRKAYELNFNPLGIQADGVFTEGGGGDYSVDIVMESKGVVTNEGYTVEVAIPFKSLRYEAGKANLWGAHFYRRIKRFNNELDFWMPLSRDRSGLLNQAGHLTGLEGLSTERTLEIIPTLTLSESGRRTRTLPTALTNSDPTLVDPGRFVNAPIAHRAGVTIKYGITPTITLDFAYKPDFAEVEADQPVVTANQRFPIYYPEKRPFFLEGIDIFQTPLTVVHTRSFIAPDYAAKLTGKRGRNSFGLLFASDNAPGDFSEEERLDPSNAPYIDKNAYIGVLRLKRDVGKESSLGVVATTYNFVNEHNHLGGIDGRFRVDPKTIFTFQVLGTTTQRNGSTGNALGYYYNYDYTGRHFGFFVGGEGRTRDYSAYVGFTPRTNTNLHALFLRFSSDPNPQSFIISRRLTNSISTNFDWQGRLQNWTNETIFSLDLSRQSYLGLGVYTGHERLFEEEFGPGRTATQAGAFAGPSAERSTDRLGAYLYGGTTPSKTYSANFSVGYTRNAFDFDFGAGPRYPRVSPAALLDPSSALDPGPGNAFNLSASVAYQPSDALRFSADYTRSQLVRRDTNRLAFRDNIFSLRTTYQFTRFTFARARADYDTLASRINGQFLLGWAPNPGTSFYVGYNNSLSRNGFNPFTGHHEPGIRREGQTFFIKMSYLFRRGL